MMRIIKVNGEFVIDDSPMVLEGEEARKFLAEMERPRSAEEIAEKQRFLKECEEVYKSVQRKMKCQNKMK